MDEINTNVELLGLENPMCSTDDVWRESDMLRCLSDDLNTIEANIAALQTGKANVNHTHTDYASTSDLEVLDNAIATKASATHTHSDYATQTDLDLLEDVVATKANASHTHNDYVTITVFESLESEVDGKASATHTHSNYSETTHNHDEDYSPLSHSHTASEIGAAVSGHNHDEDYAAIDHSHSNYATVTSLNELSSVVSGKANASHSHNDTYYTETEIDTKLASKADSSHSHTDVYDASGSAASALTSAKAYTDSKIDALVGEGASTTLDTIGEISSAIEDNQDAIDLLNSAIANKANVADLTSHTGNTTVHITSTERNNWNAAKTHADTAHAPANAEANQNAFSNVAVGDVVVSADTKTDTLTFVAGSNVTLTPNTENDSITISATNTVYTHPTTVGNKHIPAGGSSGQILRWSADGTAVWGNDNNTTYSNATQTTSGLMSNADKTKLDGIAEGANNYTLPSAGTSLGGVKTGGDVTIVSGVITVNDDSHNHIISNVDGLQFALDGKAASGHSHDDTYYTEIEVDTLLDGKANTSHTHAIANITNLQTTLDGKAATNHGTHVSYSTTAPVMDGTASVGTASTVARSDHKHPTDTSRAAQTSLDSHTSNKSNPHSVTLAQLGVTATAAEINKLDGVTATTAELNILDGVTATTTELNYVDGVTSNIQTQLNGKAASSHTHSYAGSSSAGGAATSANKLNTDAGSATQPVYFANGIPVKTTYTLGASVPSGAKFTDTTYGVATTSANGLMSASDKSKLDGMVLATVSEVETYLAI